LGGRFVLGIFPPSHVASQRDLAQILGSLMRVLVIDPDKARAALVAEGLADVKPLVVRSAESFEAVEAEVEAFAPDVIVIACDSPDRDTLENLRERTAHNPRPVVMFVDRSAPGLADAAIEAGVAAYVVDGLAAKRVRPVLEVALTRFQLMQKLRGDLAKAQADLAARKTIDRAKGLLMKERGMDEETAYQLLRKLAMDSGRPLAAVAADLVAYAQVLKGGS
jgi:response regulator NasT